MASYDTAWNWIVSYGITLYLMVLHWYCIGISLYCMVLHGIARCCIVLYSIALYRIKSHGIAWYCIVGFGARAVSRKTPIYFISSFYEYENEYLYHSYGYTFINIFGILHISNSKLSKIIHNTTCDRESLEGNWSWYLILFTECLTIFHFWPPGCNHNYSRSPPGTNWLCFVW